MDLGPHTSLTQLHIEVASGSVFRKGSGGLHQNAPRKGVYIYTPPSYIIGFPTKNTPEGGQSLNNLRDLQTNNDINIFIIKTNCHILLSFLFARNYFRDIFGQSLKIFSLKT